MVSLRNRTLAAALIGFLLLSSCKNNGSSSLNPLEQGQNAPKLPTADRFTLKVPANAPTEVQLIGQTVNAMVSIGFAYLNAAATQEPTGSNGTWEWKATSQGLTVTIKATYDEAEKVVSWSVTIDGTDQQSGQTFNNWVAMNGTSDMEGASGHIYIYSPNSTTVASEVTWTTNNDELQFTITSEGTTWQAVVKSDGSGSITTMTNGKKTFEASWDASGAGTWASYDPTTGEQTGSGSWTS